MPPDNTRGGAEATHRLERRPHHTSVAHHHTATDTTAHMVRRRGGDVPRNVARRAYAVATEAARQAIAERVRAARDLLGDQEGAVVLELLRATLHAEVDHLIDREARRLGTARRLAAALRGHP